MSLEERIDQLERKVEKANARSKFAKDRIQTLEQTIDEKNETIQQLSERIGRLEDGQQIINEAARNSTDSVTKRAVILIAKLRNEAKPVASMTKNEAQRSFRRDGIDLEKGKIYRAFERAEELVETDCVRYVRESRSSDRKSRLVVDLREGELSDQISGYALDDPPTLRGAAGP